MTFQRQNRRLWSIVFVLGLVAPPVIAQNNDELNAGIEFNFSNPGARSLAMAGAFTALGDDATAAYANPAGLMILAKPEVAGELRQFTFSTPYVDRGHIGTPTQRGLDVIDGLQNRAAETNANALSFLSFSYPANRLAFAVYRHQLAKFRTEVNSTAIFVTDETGFVNRLFPTQGELSIDVVNYGGSAAIKIAENFLVGLGISYYIGEIDGTQRRYGHGIPGNRGTAPGQDFGEPLYTDANLVNFTVEKGNDADFGFNAGFIYKPSERWSIGSVYRRGPSFEVQAARFFVGADGSGTLFKATTNAFRVPDVFAAGVAFRPVPGLILAADVDQVRYSQLVKDFGDLQNPPGIQDPPFLKYVVDDAFEVRLGAEYLFRTRVPFALRLGVWHDPEHRIRFESGPVSAGDAQLFSSIAFQPGEDRLHVTGGGGLVFGNVGQVDIGVDVADEAMTASISFVTRFK